MDLRNWLAHLWFWRHRELIVKPEKVNVAVPKPKADLVIDKATSHVWKGIVWHHSASPDGQTRDWDGIVKYHTSYRIDFDTVSRETYERRLKVHDGKVFQLPWKSVGYHGGTEWVGDRVVFTGGRSLDQIGAHAGVKGASNLFNTEYLGLCAIGNFDVAPPKPEHWDFNLQVTRKFMEAFNIPASHVIGHREVFERLGVPVQKSCPGKAWDLNLFRSLL